MSKNISHEDAPVSHIFISYSRADIDYVKRLEQRLISEGFSIWRDNHIKMGDEWWQVVKANLRDCDAIIVVMTERASVSSWVLRETAIADYLKKPVFPLLLSGDATGDAWSIYSFVQQTDVRDSQLPPSDFYDHLERFAPRRKMAGGVRVDGIYLCDVGNPLGNEALRFYVNETVTSFFVPPSLHVERTIGNDHDQLSYTVQDETIQFNYKGGRNVTGRLKNSKLSIRVEYPNGQKESRWFSFVPFE